MARVQGPRIFGVNLSVGPAGKAMRTFTKYGMVTKRALSAGPIEGNNYTVIEMADATAIRIVAQPKIGTAKVAGANRIVLDFSDHVDNFENDFEGDVILETDVTRTGGTTREQVAVSIRPAECLGGHDRGEIYMLETAAANGDLIVEPGRRHRKIHCSHAGLNAAAIAARHGNSASNVTDQWLETTKARDSGGSLIVPDTYYGETEALALNNALATPLFQRIARYNASSTWILFDSDQAAPYTGALNGPEMNGESPLHPLLVGTYGSGANRVIAPVPGSAPMSVVRGIDVTEDYAIASGSHTIASDVAVADGKKFTYEGNSDRISMHHTLHRCRSWISTQSNPSRTGTRWSGHANREFNLRSQYTRELAVIESAFNLGGWEHGYHLDVEKQPPSIYAHGFYIDTWGMGLYCKGSLISQGSNTNFQVRYGFHAWENVSLMAQLHILCTPGQSTDFDLPDAEKTDFETTFYGAHSGFYDNVFHKGGGWEGVNLTDGAGVRRSEGFRIRSPKVPLQGNIIMNSGVGGDHIRWPAGGWQRGGALIFETGGSNALTGSASVNDTLIYDWSGEANANLGGLSAATLAGTTIEAYTAAELNSEDKWQFIEYLETLARPWEVWEDFRKWMLNRVGKDYWTRANANACRYSPGDNRNPRMAELRHNWSGDIKPGGYEGDSVALDGWEAIFTETMPNNLGDFDTGDGGRWIQFGGVARIAGDLSGGGILEAQDAGQIRLVGTTQGGGGCSLIANNGRVEIKSTFDNADFTVRGAGELLLNGDVTVDAGKSLTVRGDNCCAGWDDDSGATPTLTVNGKLKFTIGWSMLVAQTAFYFRPVRDRRVDFSGGSSARLALYWSNYRMLLDEPLGKLPTQNESISCHSHHQFKRNETYATNKHRVNRSSKFEITASLGKLAPFSSGHYGARNVSPSVTLGASSVLEIDLIGHSGALSHTLIKADRIFGTFDTVSVLNLGPDRDATVRIGATTVTLTVTTGGTGRVTVA